MGLRSTVNLALNRWAINAVEAIAVYSIIILDYFRPFTKIVSEKCFLKNGIRINGSDPWDIQVKNEIFYAMIVAKGLAGFMEAFVEDFIECADFEEFFFRVAQQHRNKLLAFNYYHPYLNAKSLIHKVFDAQTEENTTNTVGVHYDYVTGAETHEHLTDTSLQYSTMIFKNEEEIITEDDNELRKIMDEAADRMRDLLARKLKLEPGMKVLDIGCGYGGLAKYLAENYNVHVTGVTVSQDMAKRAKEACKGHNVTIHAMDYRRIRGKFDRIVSVEMFEHVGEHHHREFFENVNNWLVDDGIFVLNTTSVNHANISSYEPCLEVLATFYVWMPRAENIILHSKGLFIIQDWQNFGHQLGLTCKAMLKRLKNNLSFFEKRYNRKEFRRIFAYLSFGSGLYRGGSSQVYSIVFSKNGFPYNYCY